MAEKLGNVINTIASGLAVVVVAFALLLVGGKPFGVHAYAVLSGSMEPEYRTGSLIYVKEVNSSELDPGDVITFMTGKDSTVTHRIVSEVLSEDGVTRFETKGDANDVSDGKLVHPDNVIGVPIFEIPLIGYVVNYIQFPPGTYIAISFCAVLVCLMFLPDLLPGRKDEDDEEDCRFEEKPSRRSGAGRSFSRPSVGAHREVRPSDKRIPRHSAEYLASRDGLSLQPTRRVQARPEESRHVHTSCSDSPRLRRANVDLSSSSAMHERGGV